MSYNNCDHYLTRCMQKAECCHNFYACRICHDDTQAILDSDYHKMDRFKVKEIRCNACHTLQEPSQYCINEDCKICFGKYFCKICNLYDDREKDQYHCDKCGICRIGKVNTFHCDICNMCLDIRCKNHKCINKLELNCPICMEEIFTSREAVTILKCGHSIHHECLIKYAATNYKCPICNVAICDMTEYYTMIDNEIQNTPMPDEYKDTLINILCNDCLKESETLFHVLGLKCKFCNSYNSKRI